MVAGLTDHKDGANYGVKWKIFDKELGNIFENILQNKCFCTWSF